MRFWKPRWPYGNKNYGEVQQEKLRKLPTVIIDAESGVDITGTNPRTGMPFTRQEGQKPLAVFEPGIITLPDGSREHALIAEVDREDVAEYLTNLGYFREDTSPKSGEKELKDLTIIELKQLAKAKKIPGYGGMNKAILLEALDEHSATD